MPPYARRMTGCAFAREKGSRCRGGDRICGCPPVAADPLQAGCEVKPDIGVRERFSSSARAFRAASGRFPMFRPRRGSRPALRARPLSCRVLAAPSRPESSSWVWIAGTVRAPGDSEGQLFHVEQVLARRPRPPLAPAADSLPVLAVPRSEQRVPNTTRFRAPRGLLPGVDCPISPRTHLLLCPSSLQQGAAPLFHVERFE
jgi:hypothetical protein